MSVNSSSNSSLHPPLDEYHNPRVCIFIFTALFIVNILLLPLFILVLYVGYQRWRKQRSVGTAAMMSHSDIFTFNMVVLELTGVLGSCVYCYGTYANLQSVMNMGLDVYTIISPGQSLFHLLTCVERYLAVVHPVTYLGLKQAGGIKIRNISIGCVWLLCVGSLGLTKLIVNFNTILNILLLLFSSIVVSFCSLSVLCVLIRPVPGEVGGNRERVDQPKQRAFLTIMAIMGALLVRFLSSLVFTAMYIFSALSSSDICLLGSSAAWLSLPSSLVLPLLFLHRAGKLPAVNTVSTRELG